MKLIDTSISRDELTELAKNNFGLLVKAVVDVKKQIMVVDASLHSDEEAFLLNLESEQANLWGINLYPDLEGEDFVEFDSMINLRPGRGNNTRGIEDEHTRKRILDIVSKLVR